MYRLQCSGSNKLVYTMPPPPGYALSEKALLSDQKNAVQPENKDNTKQNENSQQFLVLPEGDE